MKTSIALVSAALLLGAALARPSAVAVPPRAVAIAPLPEGTPFLDARTETPFPSAPPADTEHRVVAPPAHLKLVTARVARLLELAFTAFHHERYVRAADLCEGILRVDPEYGVALDFRRLAQRCCHMKITDMTSLDRAIEDWVLRTRHDGEQSRIPWPETFRMPTRDAWAEIEARLGDLEDPIAAIERTLDTLKVDLDFERTPYEDILSTLRDISGLHILLDARVDDKIRLEPPVTIRARDMTLRQAILKVLLEVSPFFDLIVTEEKAVLLTHTLPGSPVGLGESHDDRLARATRAFNLERFSDTIALCDEVLGVEGDHAAAAGLRHRAVVEIQFRRALAARPRISQPAGTPFEALMDATRVDLDVQNWPLSANVEEPRIGRQVLTK